jgi:hypothetical protein
LLNSLQVCRILQPKILKFFFIKSDAGEFTLKVGSHRCSTTHALYEDETEMQLIFLKWLFLHNTGETLHPSLNPLLHRFHPTDISVILYFLRINNFLVCKKLQSFVHRCLRRIVNVTWPLTITNEELWKQR